MRRGFSIDGPPGVLFSNGMTWIECRRLSLNILKNFGLGKNALEEIIEEEVDNLLQNIEDHWIDTPLDVYNFFNIAVLASLWRIISGESLKMDDSKLIELMSNVQEALKEFGNPLLAISLSNISLYRFVNKIGLFNFQKNLSKVFEYCLVSAESHKEKSIDGDNPSTFIEAFLYKVQTTKDPSHPLHGKIGEHNLVNVLLDFFLAGSDTTSNTLNWAMLYMIQNPGIQAKVREELQTNIGSKKVKMLERSLTPYTEAVLHEISRKGNIGPISLFHQISQSITVGQYNIPSNTVIIPVLGEIMHDPNHFPNPSNFNPERYLTKKKNGNFLFTPHPRVVQFGIGKRKCLGEVLARTTLYKFFTAIIQKYKIISGQDEPIVDKRSFVGLVVAPQPYKLKFVKL